MRIGIIGSAGRTRPWMLIAKSASSGDGSTSHTRNNSKAPKKTHISLSK